MKIEDKVHNIEKRGRSLDKDKKGKNVEIKIIKSKEQPKVLPIEIKNKKI